VPAADPARPLSAAEANKLFQPVAHASALVLAVSGGPDSTALLVLAARWRRARRKGPKLLAATVDHGLRPESAAEARAVKRLALRLRVPHRTLRWRGKKPKTGLQQAARNARYRLLGACARSAKADYLLTAHTLDDQAETVLIRMSRGSGITGLCGMQDITPLSPAPSHAPRRTRGLAGGPHRELLLVRPLLEIAKARLVATLKEAGIPYLEDPSNRDPRFARSRLRAFMPALAREGLDAGRIALFARRVRRAETALETAVGLAAGSVSESSWATACAAKSLPPSGLTRQDPRVGTTFAKKDIRNQRHRAEGRFKERSSCSDAGPLVLEAKKFFDLPAEIGIRLLGRAVAQTGHEGPARLGKLETLYELLASAKKASGLRLRRTLAGAMVTLREGQLVIERAPPRSRRPSRAE
jgi:tRNA(Ile)-lysidine synthase